jgi:hypothetical protein
MIHYQVFFRHSLKTTKYLKWGQSVSKWIFELRTNESSAKLLGSEMYESWYMPVDWTALVLLSSLLRMTLTTRYSVFLSTGQFWTQCLNKLQFIPGLLSEIRHRWPLIRQTYLEHPLVWARSPHPQNSKRFSVTRPGWNVGLPSLLWHSPQLWQQICQLFEPAALYPFTDWSPELLSTDKKVASFENFQGSRRKSNPVPPILWRSASTNCAIARYPKNTGVRIYQQSARREFSYRCMSSRMLRRLELKIFSDVSKYTAWKCGQ